MKSRKAPWCRRGRQVDRAASFSPQFAVQPVKQILDDDCGEHEEEDNDECTTTTRTMILMSIGWC